MSKEFENSAAQVAADRFRANPDPRQLSILAQTVLTSPLLVPVVMDREPEVDDKGNMKIAGDTKLRLVSVRTKDGRLFFPMFSSTQEAKDFYKDQKVLLIPLQFNQYHPMIRQTADKTQGIVINPSNANVPLRHDLLNGMSDAFNRNLNMARMKSGQKIHLKNPENGIDDLEAALISSGFNEEPIRRIYLKERVINPEKPEETHWFVVIDSEKPDSQIFSRIAERCREFLHGKEMEFIFTDQKLGQDIAKTSQPLYERMDLTI